MFFRPIIVVSFTGTKCEATLRHVAGGRECQEAFGTLAIPAPAFLHRFSVFTPHGNQCRKQAGRVWRPLCLLALVVNVATYLPVKKFTSIPSFLSDCKAHIPRLLFHRVFSAASDQFNQLRCRHKLDFFFFPANPCVFGPRCRLGKQGSCIACVYAHVFFDEPLRLSISMRGGSVGTNKHLDRRSKSALCW